jgi:hypothetical protein
MTYELRTTIDITKTNAKWNIPPFNSKYSLDDWIFLRNQQRNYDVTVQILGLRFQPENISIPIHVGNEWVLYFEYDYSQINIDEILQDFNKIPVVSGLNEKTSSECFISNGKFKNIRISINNIER